MHVTASDLKFPRRSCTFAHDKLPGLFFRLWSRRIAAFILNSDSGSYQMWDERVDRLFQASKYDLAHWILYNVGYECCIHDLQKMHRKRIDP